MTMAAILELEEEKKKSSSEAEEEEEEQNGRGHKSDSSEVLACLFCQLFIY